MRGFKDNVNNSKMFVTIRNLDRGAHTYSLTVEYMRYEGAIIFENNYNDKFDEILSDVYDSGKCTKLYIKSSNPLSGTDIVPTFSKLNPPDVDGEDTDDDDFEFE